MKESTNGQLDALRRKVLDVSTTFYSERTVVMNFTGHVLVEGRVDLREFNRNILEASPDVGLTALNSVVRGNSVMAEETLTGATTPGLPADFVVGFVNGFREGLISIRIRP